LDRRPRASAAAGAALRVAVARADLRARVPHVGSRAGASAAAGAVMREMVFWTAGVEMGSSVVWPATSLRGGRPPGSLRPGSSRAGAGRAAEDLTITFPEVPTDKEQSMDAQAASEGAGAGHVTDRTGAEKSSSSSSSPPRRRCVSYRGHGCGLRSGTLSVEACSCRFYVWHWCRPRIGGGRTAPWSCPVLSS